MLDIYSFWISIINIWLSQSPYLDVKSACHKYGRRRIESFPNSILVPLSNHKNEIPSLQGLSVDESISEVYLNERSTWAMTNLTGIIAQKRNTNNLNIRIIGGEDAKVKDYPWMAAIHYNQRDGLFDWSRAWGCGGSLINERYVLTAAHCIFNTRLNKFHPQ